MTHYPLIMAPQQEPEIYFNNASHSTTNTNTFSFTSMDFNVDNPNRMVIVAVNYYEFDTSATISSITVGGVTPTLVANSSRLISGGTGSFIYAVLYRVQPTGASGTVAITFNRAIDYGCSVGVWSAYNLASTTPVTTATGTPALSVTTQPGDVVVAAATGAYAGGAMTWTGVTGNYDSVPNNLNRAGGSILSSTSGSLSVNAVSTGANVTMAVGVWR